MITRICFWGFFVFVGIMLAEHAWAHGAKMHPWELIWTISGSVYCFLLPLADWFIRKLQRRVEWHVQRMLLLKLPATAEQREAHTDDALRIRSLQRKITISYLVFAVLIWLFLIVLPLLKASKVL